MNDHKFCFIACTNNEIMMAECIEYINRLYIPDGYEIDLITVSEAASMTSGYNEAMSCSDAKYKIYLHQDVFITNRFFLQNILDIFNSDPGIGLIGMVGYPKIAKNGVMWYEKRVGAVPMYGASEAYKEADFDNNSFDVSEDIVDVAVADGLMLITSQDVEWDEEFDKWDFYDATQCVRFRDAGYRVVVPRQKLPWFVHDDGMWLTIWNYNKYRHLFLDKYQASIERLNGAMARKLDNQKIAFIMCVNDDMFFEECKWYIERLELDDYKVEIVPIRNAGSIASGYNMAMEASDAKYKFYIHQDVFITDASLILDTINHFKENPHTGLIGVVGTDRLPQDALFWNSWNLGGTYVSTPTGFAGFAFDNNSTDFSEAQAIDGMFMATQYDLYWRNDIGLKWDYYDISHSLEFLRSGYNIKVLPSNNLRLIHDCGVTNVANIDKNREIFVKAYSQYGFSYAPLEEYETAGKASKQLSKMMKDFYKNAQYAEIINLGSEMEKKSRFNLGTDGVMLLHFARIHEREVEKNASPLFINSEVSYEDKKREYVKIAWDIRRYYYTNDKAILSSLLKDLNINNVALEFICKKACGNSNVINKIKK